FVEDAHAEGVETAATVLLRRRQRPETGGLRLGRQTFPVLFGEARGVGIEALLERDDLLADEATDLFAQDAQLVGQREAGEHGCHSITWSAPTVTTAGWYRRSLAPSHRPRGLDKRPLRPRLVSTRATPRNQ